MHVLAINGSPKENGNTYAALKTAADELQNQGISTEIVHIGNKNIRGCIACGGCFRNKNEKCVFEDVVNPTIQKMKEADAIIVGTPVYYASISGTLKCFLDRAFYVGGSNGGLFRHKAAAAVAVARRSGEIATFDHINHYFTISEMFVAPSNYWNAAFGRAPGDVLQDSEGMQIMRVMARNLAFLVKTLSANAAKLPAKEEKIMTNFIR